ncbi:MAG: dihydrodipicolinate synthase family protein [Bryobacteraceae bacterium]
MAEPRKQLGGVYAAVITPRDLAGRLDAKAFAGMLEFLMHRGVRGFALNGATGEYCLNSHAEVGRMLETAAKTVNGKARLLCGIGAADLRGVVETGRLAMNAGVDAVLLPMPHFFPYGQDDLRAFCLETAAHLPVDILLYNLPQFTSGLAIETVCGLIGACPAIRGIKDSSGSLDLFRVLTTSMPGAVRLIGNDSALCQALHEGICDGVISGVAGAAPELILPLFADGGAPDSRAIQRLDEFIGALDSFPVPWGLKWIAEARGLAPARFPLPLSETRAAEGKRLQEWFRGWQS